MTNPAAAFQATVHGFRTVPSRGVISITIECPIEEHARIAEIAQHGAWVAVARLETKESLPVKDSMGTRAEAPKSYAQEAGKWCANPEFQTFLKNYYGSSIEQFGEEDAARWVRHYCIVESRSKIIEGTPAAAKWSDLMARFEIARRA